MELRPVTWREVFGNAVGARLGLLCRKVARHRIHGLAELALRANSRGKMTVVDLRVKAFTNVRVSDDGLTIGVRVVTHDGEVHLMTMAYDELDWVTGALMAAGAGAYDRQIASGKLSRGNPVDPGMKVDDFRAMPSSPLQHVLVQLIGRQTPEGPLVLDSFAIDEERCRGLGRHLIESADQLAQQASKPL